MKLSRRVFNGLLAAVAPAVLIMRRDNAALGEPVAAPAPLVLARATAIVLDARETHVVLKPVPPPRRQPPRPRPKKGEKPAPPHTYLVLRDVSMHRGSPVYEVSLVLEGPNVFEATTTRVVVGALEPPAPRGAGKKETRATADGAKPKANDDNRTGAADNLVKRDSITFDATEAFAKFAKIRGYNIRNLRVALVSRAVKDGAGKESVPPDPAPPEIGAIELVRS